MPEPPSSALFSGMTDSATHHSMDQELKQFALGGFPGSPRRLLRGHLLAPLRSLPLAPATSPLSFFCLSLSLLFPSPAPLSFSLCSPFQHCLSLTLLLSLSLARPSLPSDSILNVRQPCRGARCVCLAHFFFFFFLVELPFRSPARRSEVGMEEEEGEAARGSFRGVSANPLEARSPFAPPAPPPSALHPPRTAQLLHSIGR